MPRYKVIVACSGPQGDAALTYRMTLPMKERTRIWQLGSGHAKERSKTYPGIAKAMAEQWG